MPDSLSYMVEAMKNDVTIMGLCGETCIANKAQSCKFERFFLEQSELQHVDDLLYRGYCNSSL
jgi:cellulose synthase/poly-beta-1,6-N-acetylglucosamine synthase-like glycosyltransferase